MKKFLKVFISILVCIVILLGIGAGGFMLFYTPSLTADFSEKTGEVTTGASGYLYGIAEEGVPSKNMTESIDISTVSQKVIGGLQHPIGDVDHVYTQLDNTDYIVIYLQDAYSTWYYEQESIEKMRSENKYDWNKFLKEDYLPRVEKAVRELESKPYHDKLVYCLYNECDNGVWFGETKNSSDSTYGVYGQYNAQGEKNFFEAWKITYDLVKSLAPDSLIGGPGFCDYDNSEIKNFMEYCKENHCVPEVMIYHELNDSSVYHWQSHVKDYRDIEQSLDIDELPIIVTEYGRMKDNGLPGKMLQYITQIESSKVYADNAYWRLANNLCDVAADANSPNSNWWLYRWYADLEGQTVKTSYQDLFKSNVGKALQGKASLSSQGFMGIATIHENEDKIELICGGRDGSAVVKLKNLDTSKLYQQRVCVTIEEVLYKGLSGVVDAPVTLSKTYYDSLDSNLTIDMNDMQESSAYHIVIEHVEDAQDNYINDRFIERFEFEDGELLGNAYTYSSAYATTGDKDGMVGGMEQDGDGVRLTFSVPEDAAYDLNIIFGNSNDGEWDENNKQNPNDRTVSVSRMKIDDEESDIQFSNTIKSEYTDNYVLSGYKLTKGEHTISFSHADGTIVLDSLLVMKSEAEKIAVLHDNDRTNENTKSFLVVAPYDDYYVVSAEGLGDCTAYINNQKFRLKGGEGHADASVYLMRGLNYIDVKTAESTSLTVGLTDKEFDAQLLSAKDAVLSGGAKIETNDVNARDYLTGISCDGGKAVFNCTADHAGVYALTIHYSNNDEGGKHAYNVDLIERYVTVTANGKSQDIYCRNTYDWSACKTVTCYVSLKQGRNTITLTNSGNRRFDNNTTYIPYIYEMKLLEISV